MGRPTDTSAAMSPCKTKQHWMTMTPMNDAQRWTTTTDKQRLKTNGDQQPTTTQMTNIKCPAAPPTNDKEHPAPPTCLDKHHHHPPAPTMNGKEGTPLPPTNGDEHHHHPPTPTTNGHEQPSTNGTTTIFQWRQGAQTTTTTTNQW